MAEVEAAAQATILDRPPQRDARVDRTEASPSSRPPQPPPHFRRLPVRPAVPPPPALATAPPPAALRVLSAAHHRPRLRRPPRSPRRRSFQAELRPRPESVVQRSGSALAPRGSPADAGRGRRSRCAAALREATRTTANAAEGRSNDKPLPERCTRQSRALARIPKTQCWQSSGPVRIAAGPRHSPVSRLRQHRKSRSSATTTIRSAPISNLRTTSPDLLRSESESHFLAPDWRRSPRSTPGRDVRSLRCGARRGASTTPGVQEPLTEAEVVQRRMGWEESRVPLRSDGSSVR